MQITFNEITNNKYVQIYLTKEELEKKETITFQDFADAAIVVLE